MDADRLDRFARHIVLPEIGGAGQAILAKAHVALIGIGGIGNPALQYLAAAGIGHFTLIDDDRVEASNLQRQTLFTTRDVGHGKAVIARQWLSHFDAALDVALSDRRVTAGTARNAIAGCNLVLDGSDNFATRLAVSDACVSEQIPLLSAAVGRFQGQVAAFAGHRQDQPCYRCFVGDAFDAQDCDSCAEDGMLGAMAGWVGTFAALEAIRVLLDGKTRLGNPRYGTLHLLNGMEPAMRAITITKDAACPACVRSKNR